MRQIVLDTETTGLEVSQGHRIIEIGCVELVSRRPTGRHFHRYLNPEREVDEGAVAVHGLTLAKLGDQLWLMPGMHLGHPWIWSRSRCGCEASLQLVPARCRPAGLREGDRGEGGDHRGMQNDRDRQRRSRAPSLPRASVLLARVDLGKLEQARTSVRRRGRNSSQVRSARIRGHDRPGR